MSENRRVGNWGEKIAEKYLTGLGIRLIARNVYTQYGELDLIMQDEEQVLFVEVKTRTNLAFGYPEISITRKKTDHIVHSAESYMQDHPELPSMWRIDVIAIIGRPNNTEFQVEWFQNAIS